jgi:hypothetical protein
MTLDIRGSLKNNRINANHYVVIDELFSNALDSFLIRKNKGPSVDSLEVFFDIEIFNKDFHGRQLSLNIKCLDNGAGLGEDQLKAFVTKDTSYKDDLAIDGIGKCKGSGRIQFLHYFANLSIDSVYFYDGKIFRRKLSIDGSTKEIDVDSFSTAEVDGCDINTTITLALIKDCAEKIFSNLDLKHDFSATILKQHIIISFLQRLVSLKNQLGDFTIRFRSKYGDLSEEASLTKQDLPTAKSKKEVKIFPKSSPMQEYRFVISHYELDKTEFNLRKNTVALCSKSSIALDITKKYLKSKSLENNDVKGLYHIILVESSYLDTNVNVQRSDFEIPSTASDAARGEFINTPLSFEEIYDKIDDIVIEMLSPPDWDRQDIVKNIELKYGISSNMLADAKVRIRYGDTEEGVVERTLSSYQTQIIKDTNEIFDIKKEIAESNPNSEKFRKKVNELAWKYTSSLKSIDMANLSQVVVRRTAILEILGLAVKQELLCQTEDDTKKKKNEALIHNIFFPMQKDSSETADHDIWILNEEYNYYDYISSDKSLSKILWTDSEFLFDASIDDELEKILEKNYEDNSRKRPDIAIFSKGGSAIIIEFKAPGVSMDEHIGDLMEYSQLLAAKSKGKLKKFYGYLIGTDINQNRITGYNKFPNGKGWFGTHPITEHDTGTRLGELYSEIIFYDDIIDRANTRLEVYKKKLGLSFNSDISNE